jgi:hypothetical protein
MEFETVFNGTPTQFFSQMLILQSDYRHPSFDATPYSDDFVLADFECMIDAPIEKEDYEFHRVNQSKAKWVRGKITASSTPDGKTLLRVWAKDKDWPYLSEAWELIESELQRQGWIGAQSIISNDEHFGNEESRIWEQIPDHEWDRIAVEMWCEGRTAPEIAKEIGVSSGRVNNRITDLRKVYPTIPYHKKKS